MPDKLSNDAPLSHRSQSRQFRDQHPQRSSNGRARPLSHSSSLQNMSNGGHRRTEHQGSRVKRRSPVGFHERGGGNGSGQNGNGRALQGGEEARSDPENGKRQKRSPDAGYGQDKAAWDSSGGDSKSGKRKRSASIEEGEIGSLEEPVTNQLMLENGHIVERDVILETTLSPRGFPARRPTNRPRVAEVSTPRSDTPAHSSPHDTPRKSVDTGSPKFQGVGKEQSPNLAGGNSNMSTSTSRSGGTSDGDQVTKSQEQEQQNKEDSKENSDDEEPPPGLSRWALEDWLEDKRRRKEAKILERKAAEAARRELLLSQAREAALRSHAVTAQGPNLPKDQEQDDDNKFDMLQDAKQVRQAYELEAEISQGTYGVVFKAKCRETGEPMALKYIKLQNPNQSGSRGGYPITALREMGIMQALKHQNVLCVREVVCQYHHHNPSLPRDIYMVLDYMDFDLRHILKSCKYQFSQSEVKCLMRQLVDGMQYLHDNWVMHRDLKTANLLYNNRGELKICDFGMARDYQDPLQIVTWKVVTQYYRAPELLLSDAQERKKYGPEIDMWSIGCIFFELLTRDVLFEGEGEFDQIKRITSTLGPFTEDNFPGLKDTHFAKHFKLPGDPSTIGEQMLKEKLYVKGISLEETGLDLLLKLLTYDPAKRITIQETFEHPYFYSGVPMEKLEFMPTFSPRRLKSHKK